MKATDTLKALLFAFGIMVVNVAISFVVVGVYSVLIEPGRDDAFYQEAARRDPLRKGLAFAACIVVFYGIVDVFVLLAAGATLSAAGIVTLSLSTKLAGALLGASLGLRRARAS